MKKKRTAIKGIIIAIVVIIALFLALIGFITDFLWFRELGYVSVFLTKLFTQLKIGVPVFIVISFLAYVYLKFLKKGYFKRIESEEVTDTKRLNKITWALAAVFGLLVTFASVTNLWFEALKFAHSTGFDIADPLFKLDVSFYLFQLPFIQELATLLIGVIIAFAILTVVYYSILLSVRTPQMFDEAEEEEPFVDPFAEEEQQNPNMGFDNVTDLFGKFGEAFTGKKAAPKKKKAKKQFDNNNFSELIHIAEKQLIIVGVLFFIMVAVNLFLQQFTLLYRHTGVVYGAGFTDVNITLWVYRIMAVLALVSAVTFVLGVKKRNIKKIIIVPIAMIAVGILGTAAGMLVQNFVVSPDEISKESKYLAYNIEYTQYAYDLDDVTIKPFAASNTLSGSDIANNEETIKNIRINDYDPAKKFYNQTQAIRQYYNFTDVDVDRYMVNGEYTQTFLSAREIDEADISNTWLNTHLKYTHGYGITLSRVDEVTSSGQPDMMISNIPPESDVEEIQIKQPGIYFGENTNNYILVNTDEKEFDYPDGETNNKYTNYSGTAGIRLNPMNKLMFSIRERSLKLLVSSNLTSDSRIVINRNIMDRVQEIMPYLAYDEDPYIVAADGKLYWMLDAYTASDRYPYSEPYNETGTNYVRNSVKVVIDAYDGSVDYYLVDHKDPIANTFKSIYPKLFKDFDKMPEALQAHIRYPNMLFNIQANVYKKYHMTDVNIFYQSEDMWDIAEEIYGTKATSMTPNYYIMKLPGEESAEFVNSIPYTPKNKKNMTGLLVARNDGENYGELVLYQMPKSKVVYGPRQVEALIDQNTEISKEFSLWDSAGSTYSRGNLFVIPIEDSLIYVEPVYLEAKEDSIPEVKRVIVVYGDQIAYESTLAEALNSLFGEGSANSNVSSDSDSGSSDTMSQAEIITKAQEAFNNAEEAQKNGDWAKYGQYLNELEKYLNML